jgi:hypothetical protein
MGEKQISSEGQPAYHSYMLRLWLEDKQSGTWRMSLENAHTGEQRGFAGLDALFEFLYQLIELPWQVNRGQVLGKEVDSKPLNRDKRQS